MSVSILRYFVCCVMIALLPPTLLSQELPGQTAAGQPGGAILHTQGGVWVNGAEARDSSAVFPGDLIETKTGFSANLILEGSTVVIGSESITKFQGDYLELDHGTVSVGTSRSFRVRVNCLGVVPVLNQWTQYEVADVSRSIDVAAHKDDVNVEHEGGRKKASAASGATQQASVHEGERHSYDETEICGAPAIAQPGSPLSPKWIALEAGGGAAILCLLVCGGHGGGEKKNISQSSP